MQSAASSGSGTIRCAHFRCSNILGISDVVHILFNDSSAASGTSDTLTSSQVVMNLVRFQIEKYISTSAINTEEEDNLLFCSTPLCRNIFSFPKKNEKESWVCNLSGSNFVICACGASICADCKGKGHAHLGLTCKEYQKVRKEIDSGRMDDEFKR